MAKSPTAPKTALTEGDVEQVDPVTEATPALAPQEAAAAPEPEAEVRVSVVEFCTRKLDADPRAYAGLYAFQKREEENGRVVDTVRAYDARYAEMMGSPTQR